MNIATVSLISLPNRFTLKKGDQLVQASDVPDGHKTISEILNHTCDPFEAIRIQKAIHLFQADRVHFIEGEEDEKI